MRRKRIATANSRGTQLYDKDGRERYWHLKTARIDEARIPNYVVPPGLAETKVSHRNPTPPWFFRDKDADKPNTFEWDVWDV